MSFPRAVCALAGRLHNRPQFPAFREVVLERWQRNLIAVWPGMFAVSLGMMAVIPSLPLYIRDRFAIEDPAAVADWTALVFGAAPFAAALLGPLWGALGDAIGRKVMALRATAAIAVVMLLIPLAPSPAWMVVLRLLQGALAGYVAPAIALVVAEAPAGRQSWVIARLQLALALGLAFGPVLGAELAARLGRGSEFFAAAALAALGAASIALFAREDRALLAGRADGQSVLRAMAQNLGGVLGNRVFVVLLGLILVMRFATHMVEPFQALWVEQLGPLAWFERPGAPPDYALAHTTALVFTILAVASLLFTTSWGRLADRFGPLLCLAIVSLALAAVLTATSAVASIEQFLALRCAAAAFMAGAMTLAYSAVARRVAPTRKAVALALVQSCIQLGLAFGPLAGAVLSDRVGLRGLFVVAAGTLLLAGAGMLALRAARPAVRPAASAPRAEAPL
jgi:MFS family permease